MFVFLGYKRLVSYRAFTNTYDWESIICTEDMGVFLEQREKLNHHQIIIEFNAHLVIIIFMKKIGEFIFFKSSKFVLV